MSTSPETSTNPFPEGFNRQEWAYFGSYARMIEWIAGAMIIALFILIGLPFFCIIALPVLIGFGVANLPVSEDLVCLISHFKKRWRSLYIRAVVVPNIYRVMGFVVFLTFPMLLSWSVSSRIDMVVNTHIALVEETLNTSQTIVFNSWKEMRQTQLSACVVLAEASPVPIDCVAHVLRLEQNVTKFLLANEGSSAHQHYLPAFNQSQIIQQELAKIRSRVLPNPGILQIIFDLIPTCLDSIKQQTSWRPIAFMCFTLSFLMALFELLDRYGPWIQYRYPLLRATWVASCLFLTAGLLLLYLTTEVIVWPDVGKIIEFKYGFGSYEQAKQRLDELQSSRSILEYYLSMAFGIVISIGAFSVIGFGTLIGGKKTTAMYLVGFFLFFLALEAQFFSLTRAAEHCSIALVPVLLGSGLLFAYDHFSVTH